MLISLSLLTAAAFCQTTEPPFQLKIRAVEKQIKSGQDIYIRVTEVNTSSGVVDCSSYDLGNSNMSALYDIRDATGHPVPERDMTLPYPGSFHKCTLESGGTTEVDYLLSWLYPDLEKPGKYTIQISRPIPGTLNVTVKSNVVTIEVVQ
jgi:hypothetical protein